MIQHRLLFRLHRTMRVAAILVPSAQRDAWHKEWVAELSYALSHATDAVEGMGQGMVRDAVALRWISVLNRWRAIDWRSPETCLNTLFSVSVVLLGIGVSQASLRHLLFSRWGACTFAVFCLLGVFTVPATVVVSRFGACDAYEGDAASNRRRIARWAFLGAKLLLVVLISYLLAVVLTHPLHKVVAWLANFFPLVTGMLFNVIGVGWVFNDQRERCPTCMRLLHSPARMGPPSWSLLASNATEEMCDQGHGLLHQPHWQTSWFNNARWLQLDRTWRSLFHP